MASSATTTPWPSGCPSLYHVPQNTKVDLPLPTVKALATQEGVVGLKDSSGDLSRFAFYQAEGLALRVYTGHAATS